MEPVLFEINTPEWMQGFLPSVLTVNSYGTLIALGALIGFIYLSQKLKKRHKVSIDSSQNLFIMLLLAGFIGGKLLYYLEDISVYIAEPQLMLDRLGGGFVFYGSLLFCLPVVVLFARSHKIPLLQMLDHISITACIAHIFGRMGCLGAGCCHGTVAESIPWAITYTDPACAASPLNTPLHPTPIYSIILISSIMIVLLLVEKKQRFEGQLFLIYVTLYAIGRSIIEEFRGDEARGFLLDGFFSHSQFISLLMIIGAAGLYFYLKRKGSTNAQR